MIFKVMGIQRNSCFVDLGSGIGNTVLQAAYTIGCDAKGIECIPDRAAVADDFKKEIEHIALQHKGPDLLEEFGSLFVF